MDQARARKLHSDNDDLDQAEFFVVKVNRARKPRLRAALANIGLTVKRLAAATMSPFAAACIGARGKSIQRGQEEKIAALPASPACLTGPFVPIYRPEP
jgi:hypothetical protein